jgi:hypothetical protein
MGLVAFLLLCLLVGLIDWLIITYTPIPAQIKNLVVWVSFIVLILILLNAMGLFSMDVSIPRIR